MTPEQQQREVTRLRALYIGQKVFMLPELETFNDNRPVELSYIHIENNNRYNKGYLQLRSTDDLTDEECADIYKLYYVGNTSIKYEHHVKKFILTFLEKSTVKEYCIQSGIAVDIYSLELKRVITVSEQTERGWIKKLNPEQYLQIN